MNWELYSSRKSFMSRPLVIFAKITEKNKVASAIRSVSGGIQPSVLCNSAESRLLLRRITQNALPTVPVLAVDEIPDGLRVNAVGRVS